MRCKVVQRSPKALGEGARQKYRVLYTTNVQGVSYLTQLYGEQVDLRVLQGCFHLQL
jgi:hypothetical protein